VEPNQPCNFSKSCAKHATFQKVAQKTSGKGGAKQLLKKNGTKLCSTFVKVEGLTKMVVVWLHLF
jgi:hypothetical protein